MVAETIFQSMIFREFILPFLLIFVIVFAVLEKTKVLGDDKKQVNAITAFVLGLIFVGFAYPKEVVSNMILFLTVALIIMFVALILFSFAKGEEVKVFETKGVKWVVGILLAVILLIAVIWATGMSIGTIDFFFKQSWSNTFWTNVLFIAVIVIAIALVVRKKK